MQSRGGIGILGRHGWMAVTAALLQRKLCVDDCAVAYRDCEKEPNNVGTRTRAGIGVHASKPKKLDIMQDNANYLALEKSPRMQCLHPL